MQTEHHNIYEGFIHEIVSLLPVLNKSSDIIIDGLTDKGKIDIAGIEHHTQVIKDIVELINLNTAIVNLELNPDFFTYQQKEYINFIPLFKRATKIFKLKSEKRFINLKIEGDGLPNIFALPIIKLIPYLILDNCIKYSPSKVSIEIEYSNFDNKELIISITSLGPFVSADEIPKLTEKFYRGQNSINTNLNGKGMGLYLLDKICKLNNIQYEFICEDTNFEYNGIKYARIIQKIQSLR